LDEDRAAGERRVAAAMVEVQVTVGHPADVSHSNPGIAQRVWQWPTDRSVMRVGLGVPLPQTGIEEQQTG
jgi:hypothetical protein